MTTPISKLTAAPTVEQVMAQAVEYADAYKKLLDGPDGHKAAVTEYTRLSQMVEALAVNAERLAQLERVVAGFPQDAIVGGWTAVRMSKYARRLEIDLAAAIVDAERYRWVKDKAWYVDAAKFAHGLERRGGYSDEYKGADEDDIEGAIDVARTAVCDIVQARTLDLPDSEGGEV